MFSVKIGVFGGGNCGCIHILNKYVNETYNESEKSAPMNYAKSIKINNEDILIQFVYISDQDRYMVLYRHFYEGLDGMIFVYNVYLRYTFDLIKDWIKEFSENIDLSTIKIILLVIKWKKEKKKRKNVCQKKNEKN